MKAAAPAARATEAAEKPKRADSPEPAREPVTAGLPLFLQAQLARGTAPSVGGTGNADNARNDGVAGKAARGVAGASEPLPHLGRIQSAFGRHDLGDVRTRTGGAAEDVNDSFGAKAYTFGNLIGFRRAPDVRLAAHEATHVIQQRRGVSLDAGVGRAGDRYEQQADAVAARVLEGGSAEPILDQIRPEPPTAGDPIPGAGREARDLAEIPDFASAAADSSAVRRQACNGSVLASSAPSSSGLLGKNDGASRVQLKNDVDAKRPIAPPIGRDNARTGSRAQDVPIGSWDDPAEHEAERVASQIVTMSTPATASVLTEGQDSDAMVTRAVDHAPQPTAVRVGVGVPLDRETRQFMESRFDADFGQVRLHTDAAAGTAAARIHARAYTVGHELVFGEGEYSPRTLEGQRLIAHELTHVVQQRGEGSSGIARQIVARAATPVVRRAGGPLDQQLGHEFEQWRLAVDDFERAGQHHDAAYAMRIVLMLQGVDGDTFADEAALQSFLDDVALDALDEMATFARTGEWALAATMAFPLTWSGRVHDALWLDVNTAALAEERTQKLESLRTVADRVPVEVGEAGLPVPYAEAASLASFHLLLRHVNLDRPHVVKDMALAARAYAAAGWADGFYLIWNGIAENVAERVADGEVVVNFRDYGEFVETKRQGLEALGDRLRSVDVQEMFAAFDDDVTALTHVALIASFASALLALIPAAALWAEGDRLLADKLSEVDTIVSGEDGSDKILRAFRWAYENGYFGAAGRQILDGILSHGLEILGMAAGFIAIQFIPFLDVAVDVAVAIYSGQDALRALYALYESFGAVAAARSAVELQRASAHMAASVEGDGLRVLMDLLAISAAAKGIRARANALTRAGLSEEEALRQAMREATGEEAAALRDAAARRRITTQFDPEGALNEVLDRGVGAEIVEQALLSGMTPQRLNSLVAGIADAGRAEAVIRYAGQYSFPVNALLDAGVPVARVGDMLDLGFGLRELRACDVLLQRTGQVGDVEGLINTLGRFGSDGVAQLIRLTPEGLASVYQAGGAGALQIVLDTVALETSGSIVGFGDWVRFTIVNMNKQGTDLLNAIGELREAQRLTETLGQGERVRVGGDVRPGASFDVAVEDAAGNVLRNIDVTTRVPRLTSFRDLSEGIAHGVDKAPGALGAGTREVTIRVRIEPRTSLGRGRYRVIEPDGTFHIVEKNGNIYTRGDVLADTAANLPSIAGSSQLNRVNVVNMDGTLIGTIESRGGAWVVVR